MTVVSRHIGVEPQDFSILLVRAPSTHPSRSPPLGLGYLTAVLREAGYPVEVIDADALYANVQCQDIVEHARQIRPAVIGVTLNTHYVSSVYPLLRDLSNLEKATLVVGGPHTTHHATETIDAGADIAVRGEGEATVLELCDALRGRRQLSEVAGLSFRRGGAITHNPDRKPVEDLDDLPAPDRSVFNPTWYTRALGNTDPLGGILASRGCTGHCTYCDQSIWGRRLRWRSAENVVAEICDVHHRYGVRRFTFLDSLINPNKKRAQSLAEAIAAADLPITWGCSARVDQISSPLLETMARSGCELICFGIESGNDATLARVNKGFTVAEARQGLEIAAASNIDVHANFILGYPWETAEDIAVTTEFIRSIRPLVNRFNLSSMVAVPGTELYAEFAERCDLTDWWMQVDARGGVRGVSPHGPVLSMLVGESIGGFDQRPHFPARGDAQRAIEEAIEVVLKHNMAQGFPKTISGKIASRTAYYAAQAGRVTSKRFPAVERLPFKWVEPLQNRLRRTRKQGLAQGRGKASLRLASRRFLSLATSPVTSRFPKWVPTKPSLVTVMNTGRCNARCTHCDYWENQKGTAKQELSLFEWQQVLADLRSWLGSCFLLFSGGESLVRDDCIDLLTYASNLGLFTSLNTNGYLLDESIAKQIVAAGVRRVTVSLYSLKPEVHDAMRGRSGMHKKAVAGIRHLLRWRESLGQNTLVRIGVLLNKSNLDEIEEIVAWCEKLGVRVLFQPLQDNLDASAPPSVGWHESNPLWPETNQIVEVLQRIETLKVEGYPIDNSAAQLAAFARHYRGEAPSEACIVGQSSLIIDPRGDVRFCYLSEPIGNVTVASLSKIWSSPRARQRRRDLSHCMEACSILSCQYDRKTILERVRELRHLISINDMG